MSLLFNMLSRLVITFLTRSKGLLISWASLVAQLVSQRVVRIYIYIYIYIYIKPWQYTELCRSYVVLS